MALPNKVRVYNANGGCFEIEDTPPRRAWAAGKGFTSDEPPKAATPKPPASPEDSG